jgi:hypothetical protein
VKKLQGSCGADFMEGSLEQLIMNARAFGRARFVHSSISVHLLLSDTVGLHTRATALHCYAETLSETLKPSAHGERTDTFLVVFLQLVLRLRSSGT